VSVELVDTAWQLTDEDTVQDAPECAAGLFWDGRVFDVIAVPIWRLVVLGETDSFDIAAGFSNFLDGRRRERLTPPSSRYYQRGPTRERLY
jgi:hypothetical protein